MLPFRNARQDDLDQIYAISLATGDGGKDASHLYRDTRLIGHIYSAPYVALGPEATLVVEDELGIAGYIIGAYETSIFEARLEREWWPDLRALYAEPVGDPSSWTADERRAFAIHHPRTMPQQLVDAYPAHIHMNLLPRLQGQGVGSRLLDEWVSKAGEAGVNGIHLGVNAGNPGGQRFWSSRGFMRLQAPLVPQSDTTVWFGRAI
jgi:GNAT superfamily N-acetyltransferase